MTPSQLKGIWGQLAGEFLTTRTDSELGVPLEAIEFSGRSRRVFQHVVRVTEERYNRGAEPLCECDVGTNAVIAP